MIPLFKSAKIVALSFKPFGFVGCTLYPFIFLKGKGPYGSLINHELVHWQQQERFWKWAGPLGLLAWLFLYFCVLPYKWHPFRTKWEKEAYIHGSGMTDEAAQHMIDESYFKTIRE